MACVPRGLTSEKWWDMFKALNTTLDALKEDYAKIKGAVDDFDNIKTLQTSLGKRVNVLEQFMLASEAKNQVLSNLVITQEQKIESLTEEITQMKKEKVKKNIILMGLEEEKVETKNNLITKLKSFFKEKMEIQNEITIVDAFCSGPKNWSDRPVKIKLKLFEDKILILKNTVKLKGLQNVRKRLFKVTEEMDSEAAEKKKVYKELLRENYELPDEEKMSIKFNKDRIIVDNQVISKKVRAPTAKELLSLSIEEMEEIKATKLIVSQEHHEKQSDYYSYVQKVKSFHDVQSGLLKLRLKHGDATHVSCTYSLKNAKGPFLREGHDDKEFGVGRAILSILKEKGVNNCCVYIVRYYGRIRLGARRFQIIKMLTEGGIATYQYKAAERRSRLFRANSQESIKSAISALSFDEVESEIDRKMNTALDKEV